MAKIEKPLDEKKVLDHLHKSFSQIFFTVCQIQRQHRQAGDSLRAGCYFQFASDLHLIIVTVDRLRKLPEAVHA
jgi:hypothetical protein